MSEGSADSSSPDDDDSPSGYHPFPSTGARLKSRSNEIARISRVRVFVWVGAFGSDGASVCPFLPVSCLPQSFLFYIQTSNQVILRLTSALLLCYRPKL